MDFLIEIIDFFFVASDMPGVDYAIAWLPAAVTAGSILFDKLSQSGEKKKANRLRDKRTRQQDEALGSFIDAAEGFETRAEGIDTDQSTEELYGELMQLFGDRAQAGTDQSTRDVFRTLMASGGDVTGQGASLIGSLRQGANRSVSDIVSRFSEMTDRRNLQQQSRKDNMYSTSLGARGNLFSALSGLATDAQGRVDRRSTAGRQFVMDAIGTGAQLYGQQQANK